MANVPANLFLREIDDTALTTISTPGSGEIHTELWLLVRNTQTVPVTLTVYHGDGEDLSVAKKIIQGGQTHVFTELAGSKVNFGQALKVQGSIGGYVVDLSANVYTSN